MIIVLIYIGIRLFEVKHVVFPCVYLLVVIAKWFNGKLVSYAFHFSRLQYSIFVVICSWWKQLINRISKYVQPYQWKIIADLTQN